MSRVPSRKRKKPKGFDGEVAEANVEQMMGMMPLKAIHGASLLRFSRPFIPPNAESLTCPVCSYAEPAFTTQRTLETVQRDDGGAETHVEVRCTLAEIARATNLRIDDAAFALSECGLLARRIANRTRMRSGTAGAGGEERATRGTCRPLGSTTHGRDYARARRGGRA